MTSERSQLLVNRDQICRLYGVWSEMPEDKPRRALDPLALGAPLLPNLALLKALPDGFQYDLVGERVSELSNAFHRGATASVEKETARRPDLFRQMRAVARTRQPGARFAALDNPSGYRPRYFSMILPLSIDGGTARDLLLGVWPLPACAGSGEEMPEDDVASVPQFIDSLRCERRASPKTVMCRIAFGEESLASR
ncbi:PAS domain-containing protein [Nisaea sediminum]|uniref:hypothetical protein n=1 Tax=Nisaea sediminum TaxID=2775867 RepID=UPI001867ED57|nr:hypothetical protein [Nisaea sediminum]